MPKTNKRLRNSILFFTSALVCLVLDQVTKALADTAATGTVLWRGIPGVFDFTLVHNTGGAWGILDGSVVPLAIFGVVISILCLVAAHIRRDGGGVVEMLAYALILAGGAGNAIDRFARGYVVDFLDFRLIDFPVFNVADICVVCGFALVFILLFISLREGDDATKTHEDANPAVPEGSGATTTKDD